MMVSEIELPHAENTHFFVQTLIPDSLLLIDNEQYHCEPNNYRVGKYFSEKNTCYITKNIICNK